MNNKMNNKFELAMIFNTLVPFMIAGIAIALFIGILFMFSYVVIWGLIIGGVLWIISVIKEFLFPGTKKTSITTKSEGRIIEHDDKK